MRYRTSTPCKHTVSDTISSPSRAAFQLSITVLVHYRSGGVFSLATSSWLLPTGFLESRRTLDQRTYGESPFRLPGYHRLWLRFPADSTIDLYSHAIPLGETSRCPQHPFLRQPKLSPTSAVKLASNSVYRLTKKGLDCSAFARRY